MNYFSTDMSNKNIKNSNTNLHKAKSAKKDEFYTQLADIEKELRYYKTHFKDKIVFCNCDDPTWSAFWKYFHLHFAELGLKKLISAHYDTTNPTYKLIYTGGNDRDISVGVKTLLNSNGDFLSQECMDLLDKCDIVCSNPPFSKFKLYMSMLLEKNKKFIILGNLNSVTYTNIMPLITQRKLWLGVNSGHFWFKVPQWYEEKKTDFIIDENGEKWRRIGNICWYTNLDIPLMHKEIPLSEEYSPKYPMCTNIDAIFVRCVAEIPKDYYGKMAVPITILPKLSPEQFTVLGFDKELTTDKGRVRIMVDGKEKTQYARLIIKRNVSE